MRVCPACSSELPGRTWSCDSCGWEAPTREGFPDVSDGAGQDGFDEASFSMLAELEDRSFWFRGRNELILWALETHAPGARSFLEIGSGTGYVLQGIARRHPELHLVAGEPHVAGLRTSAERVPAAESLVLDGRSLPFRDEFDAAGAFDVLEHIEDDEAVLAAMRTALRPGGTLLLTVPQHPWLWSSVDEFGHHVRRYRRRELVERVRRAGLQLVRATSFVSLMLPLVLVSRARQRGKPIDPRAEFEIDPRVDRLLERMLAAERRMIRSGVSLPAGSSLLVVARRPA
jgi:SAM-dependent methyltransferase